MLPVQLTLRDGKNSSEITLSFQNPLHWEASESTKTSAVLGASRFALYGTSVEDWSTGELLQVSKWGFVAFEFEKSSRFYRIERGVTPNGKFWARVFIAQGSTHERVSRHWKPLAEVQTPDTCTQWVANEISISEQVELLHCIANLSSLTRLSARAGQREQALRERKDRVLACLQEIAPMNTGNRQTLELRIAAKSEALALQNQQLEANLRLQVQGRRWQELAQMCSKIQKEMEQIHRENTEIKALQQARLEEVGNAMLRLGELQTLQSRLNTSENTSEKLRVRLDSWQQQVQSAQKEKGLLYWQLQAAREAMQRHEMQREMANHSLVSLGLEIHTINEWERLGDELKLLDAELETYPSHLDETVRVLEAEVEAGRELEIVLPLLKRLFSARCAWASAGAHIECLYQQHEEDRHRLSELQMLAQSVDAHIVASAQAVQVAWRASALAETIRDHACISLQHLQTGDTAKSPLCHHCGQLMSESHLISEKERLERTVESAAFSLGQAERDRQTAEIRQVEALAQSQTVQIALSEWHQKQTERQEEIRLLQKEFAFHAQTAHYTFSLLPEAFVFRVCANVLTTEENTPFELASAYPGEETIREATSQLELHPQKRQLLNHRREQLRQREVIYSRRNPASQRWGELTARYHATADAIRQKYRRAHLEVREAAQALADLKLQIKFIEQGWQKAEHLWKEARRATHQVQSLLATEIETRDELLLEMEELRAFLPLKKSEGARNVEVEWLHALKIEKAQLEASLGEHPVVALSDRETALRQLEARLDGLQREIQGVPTSAQRPVQELRVEEVGLRHSIAELTHQRELLKKLQERLNTTQTQRNELEIELKNLNSHVELHTTLTEALREDGLRKRLLHHTNASIHE